MGSCLASTTADKDGKWSGKLKGLGDKIPAGGPYTLTVKGKNETTINDVYIGDVQTDFWDEINRVPNPTDPIRNFGWPCYEGALDSSGKSYGARPLFSLLGI